MASAQQNTAVPSSPMPAPAPEGMMTRLGVQARRMLDSVRGASAAKDDALNVAVIGQMGAGKTSLIKFLNFFGARPNGPITDAELDSAHARNVINQGNERGGSQRHAQTRDPFAYRWPIRAGKQTVMVRFVDTPGLGDDQEIGTDDKHVNSILDSLGKLEQIHVVLLVLNGSDARVSARTRYVLQRLYSLCPGGFEEHLFLLFTNTRGLIPNFDIGVLAMPINLDNIICIDNMLFSGNGEALASRTLHGKPLSPMAVGKLRVQVRSAVEESQQLLSLYVEAWTNCAPLDTSVFRLIRENRKVTQLAIDNMLKNRVELEKALDKKQKIAQDLKDGKPTKEELRLLSLKTVDEVSFERQDTPHHNTVCTKCPNREACHEKCSLDRTSVQGHEIFKQCACMIDGSTPPRCACGHTFEDHIHVNHLYRKVTRKRPMMTDAERDRYQSLVNDEQRKAHLLDVTRRSIQKVEKALTDNKQNLKDALAQLHALCPYYNYHVEMNEALLAQRDRVKVLPVRSDEWLQAHENCLRLEQMLGCLTTVLPPTTFTLPDPAADPRGHPISPGAAAADPRGHVDAPPPYSVRGGYEDAEPMTM
eukprot:m.242724 g.242724  ORF g.242724 m.242724 type:complete len:590 (-) comp14092_c0_seq1:42-1811(-)